MGAIRSLQLCIIALALFSALFVGYMACQHHAVGDDRSWDWYGTSGEPSDWQPPARTQANTVRSTSFVDTATLSSPSSVSSVSSASSAAPVPPASAASWATGTMIPRIIHQTWKTKTLPAWGEVPVQTWRDVNPSFEHRLYDDADMARVVKAHYPAIWPHYQRLLPIQKADVFRYVALWAFGGVYADIDVTALEPVDSWGTRLRTRSKLDSAGLLDYRNVDFIVGFEALPLRPDWHAHYATQFQLCQWTFASAPGHWLLKAVLERITGFFEEQQHLRSKSVIKSTGPGIWSDAIRDALHARLNVTFGDAPFTHTRLEHDGFHIGTALVLPKFAFAATRPDVRSLIQHGFRGSWKKKKNDKKKKEEEEEPKKKEEEEPKDAQAATMLKKAKEK